MKSETPFWERKTLAEMTPEEWESLCDGCAQCCRLKIEEGDGRISETNVTCRLLDIESRRCMDYARRHEQVADCAQLTPGNIPDWMPATCAYRLIKKGKPLPEWHPLVSGDPRSVCEAGIALQDNVISESWISVDALLDA